MKRNDEFVKNQLHRDPLFGTGKEALWGFSPPIDILATLNLASPESTEQDSFNFLQIGGSDIRHILRTLARNDVSSKKLHFYIYEPNLHTLSRQLLFLYFLHDLDVCDDLKEKTYLFLELFGNVKIRESTARWLRNASIALSKFVTEGPCDSFGKNITLNDPVTRGLKQAEIDYIEGQITKWRPGIDSWKGAANELGKDKPFHINEEWENRMRLDMKERYDSRKNIVDWDYQMSLSDYLPILKFIEYREFRFNGVAYDKCFIDPEKHVVHDYNVPNWSMCRYDKNLRKAVYEGDTKNGPFACFSTGVENRSLIIKEPDGGYRLGSDIASFHYVRALLFEFMTGVKWEYQPHVFSRESTDPLPSTAKAILEYRGLPSGAASKLSNCTFSLLGLDMDRSLQWIKKSTTTFTAMIVGVNSLDFTKNEELMKSLCNDGIILVETAKFIIEVTDEQKDLLHKKIDEIMSTQGLSFVPDAMPFLTANEVVREEIDGLQESYKEKRRMRARCPHTLAYRRYLSTLKLESESF